MEYKNEEKILLVLDVDETLIYATETELNRSADFKVFDFHIYKRPHLDQFIEQIKDDFLIAIWSSASDDYVEEIAKKIIPKEINLEFVWGRSRCTYKRNLKAGGYYGNESPDHYHYTKPLKKLKRKKYDLDKILIIDDTPHKSSENFGNAIYPEEFKGDIHDNELPKLAKYLTMLKDKKSVRRIEKRRWKNQIENL